MDEKIFRSGQRGRQKSPPNNLPSYPTLFDLGFVFLPPMFLLSGMARLPLCAAGPKRWFFGYVWFLYLLSRTIRSQTHGPSLVRGRKKQEGAAPKPQSASLHSKKRF